jgi:CBS-domain-containing membrane protein
MMTPLRRTVSEVMTRDVVRLDENDNLLNLLASLKTLHFRHLPVTDDERLVGLLTERDLLALSGSDLLPHHEASDRVLLERFRVRDVMVRDVVTASPEMSIHAAGELLLQHRFGCLPVVDSKNALVGIVTSSDFVKLVVSLSR